MKSKFLALLLSFFLAPILVQAQNVLVPNSSTLAPAKSPTVSPGTAQSLEQQQKFEQQQKQEQEAKQKAALAQQPAGGANVAPASAGTVPSYSLDSALAKTPTAVQAQENAYASSAYLQPAQQAVMIQNEQRIISTLQNALMQTQSTAALLAGNAASKTQPGLANMQQTSMQSTANLNEQILKAQKRLAVLQAGPIKIGDIAKLYQVGY